MKKIVAVVLVFAVVSMLAVYAKTRNSVSNANIEDVKAEYYTRMSADPYVLASFLLSSDQLSQFVAYKDDDSAEDITRDAAKAFSKDSELYDTALSHAEEMLENGKLSVEPW